MTRNSAPCLRNNTSWRTWLGSGALALSALSAPEASAAVPPSSLVEGLLTSAGGGAAADGNYKVTFTLYKDEVGGNPLWSEADVAIGVKGGAFGHALGSKTPLTQQVLNDLGGKGWLGLKVESDPELPRKPLASVVYALRAAVAEGLECSGCVKAGHIEGGILAGFAKTADLAKVAVTGDFADLKGGPDLTAYAKSASLAKVALSGAFADLTGGPDLSAYAKLAALADVAKTGNYSDIKGIPVLAKIATTGEYADLKSQPVLVKVGAACGTGLVIKGIKADGTHECVLAMDPANFPPDAIDEISNKLIANQFLDSTFGTPNVDIKDGFLFGVADSLQFPDIGIAQKLNVSVHITNTNIQFLTISVFDPAGVEHLLHDGDKKGSGTLLKTSYPNPTPQLTKDLTTWVGKNPMGEWTLKVVDTGSPNPAKTGLDGKIVAWSVDIQTLSSKKIAVNGKLIVTGDLQVDGKITSPSTGVVYTRWGRTTCPTDSELVYTGFMGGSQHNHNGGGGDYMCLHSQPNWDLYSDGNHNGALIYGSEYETGGQPMFGGNQDFKAPCAVCFSAGKGSTFMQPGRNDCPAKWKLEYKGQLMTEHYAHPTSRDYICVDRDAEKIGNNNTNHNGALLYPVEGECGSLPCGTGQYVQDRELTCAVCSR